MKAMTVDIEIICVGNELLIGKILNTNAQWLSKQATNLGANVKRITVVEDLVDEIANVICEAIERKPQFMITTGGLGPTFDDKTLQGIAKALNRKLEINQKALAMVKEKCEEYARKRHLQTLMELTPPRMKMANLPEKTDPVNNPIGTAPGVRVELAGHRFVCVTRCAFRDGGDFHGNYSALAEGKQLATGFSVKKVCFWTT